MLYILNVVLPQKRNFRNAITALYGIGYTRAKKLGSLLGLHPSSKLESLTQRQLNNLGLLIEKSFLIDFELKRKISLNITSLRKLETIRGYCHIHGLPVHGQRTHTNASTARKLSKKGLAAALNKTSIFKTKNKNISRSKAKSNKGVKPKFISKNKKNKK